MGYKSRYKKGDWKGICDSCGKLFKAIELRKRWDGLMVCNKDFETRHPQEFVRARIDIQTPKWTRSAQEDVFVQDTSCDIYQSSAIPGLATPGCSIPGSFPAWYVVTPESTFTL